MGPLIASISWKTATKFSSGLEVNRTNQFTMSGASKWLLAGKVNTNVLPHIWIELRNLVQAHTIIIFTLTELSI